MELRVYFERYWPKYIVADIDALMVDFVATVVI